MKLYYVVNARMPSLKAYGIQIAKMCEAFIEAGVELELIIPKTRQAHISLRDFYHLRVDVPTTVLASPDWYDKGRFGYALSSAVFMLSACWHISRRRGEAMLYTIDMDSYSYTPLALLGIPIAVEMHSPKHPSLLNRFFFKKVRNIMTTNPLIKEKLAEVFSLKAQRFIVEPNGVDERAFMVPAKEEARKKLTLPADGEIALYVGRFYDWKGMAVLQKAARSLADENILVYLVGGTKEEFETATQGPSAPLHFAGSVPHKDISLWCAAADTLLILGTKANEFSYRYTAPMKLFEYLATGRPVVSADTPALRSLATEQEVTFYAPDDAGDLGKKISISISDVEISRGKSIAGIEKAREHTWIKRAERIRAFIML